MKQRKKSFGMRISAFVLSFAMVCTLLAGVNVVAFAADDNDLIVSVHCFYNDATKGGDGEHLYTKDLDEMSWLSSLPTWNDEDEAWKAPVSSSLAVYRVYNPNSGEHHYAAADEAEWLVSQGWTQEKIAFYSDDNEGVPVYRLWNGGEGVGSHYYTTDEGEAAYLASIGWTAEDVAFYGVAEEEPATEMVAEQTGAKEITVTFDGEVTGLEEFAVSHGVIDDDIADYYFSPDMTSAIIILDSDIVEEEYTVEISDEEIEPASFYGEASELAEVVIGDELVAQGGNQYKGIIQSYNQWGEEIDVDFDKIVTGTSANTYADGIVTVTDANLSEGDVVPVSVIEGTFVKTGTMTVSAASMVADIQLSPIQMTEAESEINTTGRIDVDDISAAGRYFYVVVAHDQYGLPLSGAQLTNMLNTSLIVSNVGNAMSFVGFQDNEETGLVLMGVVGDGQTYGMGTINIVSITGAKTTASENIYENEKIASIDFDVDTLQAGKAKYASVYAENQYGEPVDLEDEVTFTGSTTTTLKFNYTGGDDHSKTESLSNITMQNATIGAAISPLTETYVFAVTGDTAGQPAIATITTGAPSVDVQTYMVSAAATVAKIVGYVGTSDSAEKGKDIAVIDSTKVAFKDSDGEVIDEDSSLAGEVAGIDWQRIAYGANVPTTGTSGSYVVVAQPKDTSLVWNGTSIKAADNATAGEHKLSLSLYKADAQGKLGTIIDQKTVTFKVFNSEDTNVTYTAALGPIGTTEIGNMIYVNATSGSQVQVVLYKTDSSGATVKVDTAKYWVRAVNGLPNGTDNTYVSGKYAPEALGIEEAGTTEVEVYVGSEQVDVVDLAYGVEPAAPVMSLVTDAQKTPVLATEFDNVTKFSAAGGILSFTNGATDYTITVIDQYGEAFTNAAWTANGDPVSTQVTTPGKYTVMTQLATGPVKFTFTIPTAS